LCTKHIRESTALLALHIDNKNRGNWHKFSAYFSISEIYLGEEMGSVQQCKIYLVKKSTLIHLEFNLLPPLCLRETGSVPNGVFIFER